MGETSWASKMITRQPAWHADCLVLDQDMGVREALVKIGGAAKIEVVPLTLPEYPGVEVTQRALVRLPDARDSETVVLGYVGPTYTQFTDDKLAAIADALGFGPVETAGYLDRGRQFWVAVQRQSFAVRGDEVKGYLALISPHDGTSAIKLINTYVRIVCQNTFEAAQNSAETTVRVVHDRDVEARVASELGEAIALAGARSAALVEAMELLADTRATSESVERVLAAAYPMPAKPTRVALAERQAEREREWGLRVDWTLKYRGAARDGFGGAATGIDTPAAAGTLWGLYQSVVEVEDYRGGSGPSAAAASTLLGDRAVRKARAFSSALAIARD